MKTRATFTQMADGDSDDFIAIALAGFEYSQALTKRIINHMQLLEGDFGGFPIDRLSHCLQSATRSYEDGQSEEYVIMCLLHDIGDTLATRNHGDIAAAILKPYVSDKTLWILENHPSFQAYYFFEHIGLDKNIRDQFNNHEWFNDAVDFCEKYDQNCFDPNYTNKPLAFFTPMLEKLLETPLPGKCIYTK